jgi:type VI secretion system secreted protein Hcp
MRTVSKGTRKAIQVVFATGMAAGAVQAGAIDSWVRIPGIDGESTNADHKGEIDVLSYSQALDSKTCEFIIEKQLDKASPALAESVAKRAMLPSVVFSARKSGEGQKDFLNVTLASVSIAAVNTSLGRDAASEQVVLKPRSVTISYRAQDAKGTLGPAITSSFGCDK